MTQRLAVLALTLSLATAATAAASSLHLRLDPDATSIDFHLGATGHDVEGSFALERGEIELDPTAGSASGQLVIDATVAETGSKKRDKTMHKKVLETETYPTFVFTAESFEGEVPESGEADVVLHGVLSIHGDDHPMSLSAKIETASGRLTAHTEFDIPYIEWGMKNPSLLVLRVQKVVHVTVDAEGELSALATATGN
ncbi:MAG: YceI family protein [Thermoanaerobaculia bacterium]|nr:YceI family protein [Thermoanaerobaculia bacterium]